MVLEDYVIGSKPSSSDIARVERPYFEEEIVPRVEGVTDLDFPDNCEILAYDTGEELIRKSYDDLKEKQQRLQTFFGPRSTNPIQLGKSVLTKLQEFITLPYTRTKPLGDRYPVFGDRS